jgi:hypothetical protein
MKAAESPASLATGSYRTGENARGEFGCASCSYGIVVAHGELPPCPMCRGELWQPTAWRPFSRAGRGDLDLTARVAAL